MFNVSRFERATCSQEDLETIYSMRFSVYSDCFHGRQKPSYDDHCRFITRELENTRCYWMCARDQYKNLVGVGSLTLFNDSSCEVGRIMVLPEHNGKGIGGEIVRDLLRQGRKAGCLRAFLSVVANNVRAIKLYRRLGFEFCESPIQGQVSMEKVLAN